MFCALVKVAYAQWIDVQCLCPSGYTVIRSMDGRLVIFHTDRLHLVSAYCMYQRKTERIRRRTYWNENTKQNLCVVLKEIKMDKVEIWTCCSMIDELLNLPFLPNVFH